MISSCSCLVENKGKDKFAIMCVVFDNRTIKIRMEYWFISITVILYYLSIIIEIWTIPVPSVASTYQLVFPETEVKEALSGKDSRLGRVQTWAVWKKTLLLLLPAIVMVGGYCFPLFFAIRFMIGGQIDGIVNHWLLMVVGILLLVVGRGVTIKSALDIRKDNSQQGDDFDLKTKGVFRLSRNPIVLGLHIGLLGMNLLFPSIWFLLLSLFYAGNIHFKILLEEDFLLAFFGEKYQKYHRLTRRYF